MSFADTSLPRRARPETLIALAAAAVVVALLLFLASQRQQILRTSPSGYDGLVTWLSRQGVDAQAFNGGWVVDAETLGLLVLPVYDTAPDRARTRPKTQEELLFQHDENDIARLPVTERAQTVQSLVVLPKWRSGMRLTGIGHPALLIPADDNQTVLDSVTGVATGDVSHIPQPFVRFDYRASDGARLQAELYIPQVFDGRGCDPIIGRAGAMVLAECPLWQGEDGATVFVLSDPDLFSNHGLRLGDNARIASDFFATQAGDGRVLVDYSDANWIRRIATREARERTWADLLRFFDYPFTILWVGAGLTMILVLWRAGRRFGPIRDVAHAPSASKRKAMQAQARLLRLTGQDGALLREYVPARMAAVANDLFGPGHVRTTTDQEMLLRHLRRHKPHLAGDLSGVLDAIRALPAQIPASEAISYVDRFEQILEQIIDDT